MFRVEHWEDEDYVVSGKEGIIHNGVLSKSDAIFLCHWLNNKSDLQNISFDDIKAIVKDSLPLLKGKL